MGAFHVAFKGTPNGTQKNPSAAALSPGNSILRGHGGCAVLWGGADGGGRVGFRVQGSGFRV